MFSKGESELLSLVLSGVLEPQKWTQTLTWDVVSRHEVWSQRADTLSDILPTVAEGWRCHGNVAQGSWVAQSLSI